MFGRKNMYKKGLADAMQAYEGFGKKQEEALERIRQEVRDGNKKLEIALAEMGESIYSIFDLLDKKEKEALYHLHTPMDIKDLEDSEKRLLLAILFQLAEDEGDIRYNDYQRKFILSVKKYLEIANPQIEAEYSSIENIDSIDIQKVFMRVILEFLYLQDEDEITDWQEEVFDYFSVNKRHAQIIECDVIRRYHILGAEGMADNYAVAVEETSLINTIIEKGVTNKGTNSSIKENKNLSLKNYTCTSVDTGILTRNKENGEEKYHELSYCADKIKCNVFDNLIYYFCDKKIVAYNVANKQKNFILENVQEHFHLNHKYVVATREYTTTSDTSSSLKKKSITVYSVIDKCILCDMLTYQEKGNYNLSLMKAFGFPDYSYAIKCYECCLKNDDIYFIGESNDFSLADKIKIAFPNEETIFFLGKIDILSKEFTIIKVLNFDFDFIDEMKIIDDEINFIIWKSQNLSKQICKVELSKLVWNFEELE